MTMFTGAFWRATAERAISTAAQAALLVFGADQINALEASWADVAGFAAGGAVLAVLKALVAANTGSSNGPSFSDAEQLSPRHRA